MFLLLNHSHIERNPGPRKTKSENCSCGHWNVTSLLLAHDSQKLSFIEGCILIYEYDFTCMTETFLNSSVLGDSENVQVKGYKLIKAGHPVDLKRDGVFIYHREFVTV